MSKSIKLKDNIYMDSKGIVHNKQALNTIINDYQNICNYHNLSESGYQKIPGGLIIQWTKEYESGVTASEYSKSVPLPISFPNACLCAICGLDDVGYGVKQLDGGIGTSSYNKSSVTFKYKRNGKTTEAAQFNVIIIALGY